MLLAALVRLEKGRFRTIYSLLVSLCLLPPACIAGAGTQAAELLGIPVGGRAAALGAAYTAAAEDAYAAVWNPAGLGLLDVPQAAFMHLSYLAGSSYEFIGFAHPFRNGSGLGLSAQYLRPGEIASTDENGTDIGSFSGHYAVYSLAGGQRVSDRVALGICAKLADGKIGDVSARAAGFDAGGSLKVSSRLRLAAVAANLGSKLRYFGQRDEFPAQVRAGALYAPLASISAMLEGDYRFSRNAYMHAGTEWRPAGPAALRLGYRTDTIHGLCALAGLTAGVGLRFRGQEFDYAWAPLGELGNTHYFSLVLRFNGPQPSPAP